MFSQLTAFSMLALSVFAAATAVARNDAPAAPTTACCSSTESSDSAAGIALLSGLGIPLEGLTGVIGLDCSPLSVVGVGSGSACSGSSVSCSNGVAGGIGIGCVPITA